jgi:glycosyltransferase involved in cell wall biosynthesis
VDILSEALAERGVDVHVLSVVEDQPPFTTRKGDVTVHREPLPRLRGTRRLPPQAWRRAWLASRVVWLIRHLPWKPTVVEAPEWGAEGLGVALVGKVPLVVRLHSSARQLFTYTRQGREWRGLDGWLSAVLEEASARRANVVVSTRSNLEEVAAQMGLHERALHAIPYPIRLPRVSPMPNGSAPRVTFIGRLEPRKAPEVVLRAAPHVLAAVPDARFVFVGREAIAPGTPSSQAWLRGEAERLGVSESIEFTGQLSSDGVADQLRRATVGVFPSRWESFGNVVAEASAIGRPVVTSAIGPFLELVDDGVTGKIVRSEDPAAWGEALVEVLRDPELARMMGEAGAPHVAQISEPGRIAELTLAAYEHAIERWRCGKRATKP